MENQMDSIEVSIRQASNGYIITCGDQEVVADFVASSRKEALEIVNELFYNAETSVDLGHLADHHPV
jgi:hypothetical protein